MIGLLAMAAAMSGNDLHGWCSGDDAGKALCAAYVSGASDGMMISPAGRSLPICPPDGVIVEQLSDLVANWLKQHPEKRQLPAAALVYSALREAFPCPAR